MARKCARFRHICVVEKLHRSTSNGCASRGFSLVEALVAVAVLGVAAAGITAVGGAARRLAETASVRAAQVSAARVALASLDAGRAWPGRDGVRVGSRRLEVGIDTTRLHPGLLEVRIVVRGYGAVGPWETWTRRGTVPP